MNETQTGVEKKERVGLDIMALAQDYSYVSDLNDSSLENLYRLVHLDFDKAFRKNSDPSNLEGLKCETVLRQEFALRKKATPDLKDKLSECFHAISPFRKQITDKVFQAETTPDINDGHIHRIEDLSADGTGVTEEAGTIPHSHNVHEFMVLPVEIGSYKSDHVGKVRLSIGKFKVNKRHENGDLDWEAEFNLFKIDDEQHLVGGIVYEPDVVDAQGDSASEDEIVRAAHNYMIKSMTLGKMHENMVAREDAVIVENYIAPVSFQMGGQFVRKGSWIMVHKILKEDLWKEIKEGQYTGFSMAGRAKDISKAPIFGKRLEEAAKTDPKLQNVWLTKQQVEQICPGCARIMESRHLTKIRIDTLLNSDKFRAQFGEEASRLGYRGLCRRFGTEPVSFMTHCKDVIQDTDVDDPESFCMTLRDLCLSATEGIMLDVVDELVTDGNLDEEMEDVVQEMDQPQDMVLPDLVKLLDDSVELEKILREVDGKWCVFSRDGSRKLGCHDTREAALEQLRAIEANKHLTEKHLVESNVVQKDRPVETVSKSKASKKASKSSKKGTSKKKPMKKENGNGKTH